MIRGAVYRIDLGRTRGHEQSGRRLGLVVSPSESPLPVVTVIPTSTSAGPSIHRPELEIDGRPTRLLVDQIRSIDTDYTVGDPVDILDRYELAEVELTVAHYLGVQDAGPPVADPGPFSNDRRRLLPQHPRLSEVPAAPTHRPYGAARRVPRPRPGPAEPPLVVRRTERAWGSGYVRACWPGASGTIKVMVTTRAQGRLWQAHRSTIAGLVGIGLMGLGLLAQVTHRVGDVFPVVLGIAGFLLLNVGIATGALLVVNNARWRRDQSYYDPDDEDDE